MCARVRVQLDRTQLVAAATLVVVLRHLRKVAMVLGHRAGDQSGSRSSRGYMVMVVVGGVAVVVVLVVVMSWVS
eukprot:14265688-Alexandrium_andersonii.AAC.1